jgi:hypothetical protein
MGSAAMPRANTPPGWSHGQKTGWNGGNQPPGMSKHNR